MKRDVPWGPHTITLSGDETKAVIEALVAAQATYDGFRQKAARRYVHLLECVLYRLCNSKGEPIESEGN